MRSSAAGGCGAPRALTAHSTYQREADTKGLRKDDGKLCSCDDDETPRLAEPPPAAGKDFRPEERHAVPCVISPL